MGWETVGAQKGGTAVYLWLIHVDVWRRPTRCCKAIILQLKKKKGYLLSHMLVLLFGFPSLCSFPEFAKESLAPATFRYSDAEPISSIDAPTLQK